MGDSREKYLATVGRLILTACWAVTGLAAFYATITYLNMTEAAHSAAQQIAGAMTAVAIVLIPYVFTRAVEGIVGR